MARTALPCAADVGPTSHDTARLQAFDVLDLPPSTKKILLTPQREVRAFDFRLPCEASCNAAVNCCQAAAAPSARSAHASMRSFAQDCEQQHTCAPPRHPPTAVGVQVAVELIITRDDGSPESYMGYRVQHNDSRGPYKVRSHCAPAAPHGHSCMTPHACALRA